jgi:NAD(P)-dependent dehydrogenase (short-subunit alcohol dehydrogenase family)
MLEEFNLAGRRALCIGAGRGIGKGVALVLAEAGAHVAVASATLENAQKVADGVTTLGRDTIAFAVDATDEDSMTALAVVVEHQFGDLDIVVNCVGDSIRKPLIALPDGPEGEMPFSDWKHVVDLNLTHAYLGARAFGPGLIARRGGTMINISSYVQSRGRLASAAYNAGKAALNQLTRDLAVEWAPYRVRVNAIGPGVFPDPDQRTPDQLEQDRAELRARVPLGREGYLRDVGLLAVYLASDAAAYVTGQVYVIDGGLGLV